MKRLISKCKCITFSSNVIALYGSIGIKGFLAYQNIRPRVSGFKKQISVLSEYVAAEVYKLNFLLHCTSFWIIHNGNYSVLKYIIDVGQTKREISIHK